MGLLQMVRLPGVGADIGAGGAAVPAAGETWVPFELALGLPLFSVDACAAVCAAADDGGLLQPSGVAQLAQEAAAHDAALRAFTQRLVSPSTPFEDEASPDAPLAFAEPPAAGELDATSAAAEAPVPMPRRPVCFDGARVREVDLEADM